MTDNPTPEMIAAGAAAYHMSNPTRIDCDDRRDRMLRDIYLAMQSARTASPEMLEECREALEGVRVAIKKARDMVPDEEEGLAAQVFAYHLNEAEHRARATLAKLKGTEQ